jgi:hypothetical protein
MMGSDRESLEQQLATEVIELGEMLFDTAIDTMEHRPATGEANDTALIEEMRAAANEFFNALRLLLETGQETGEQNL